MGLKNRIIEDARGHFLPQFKPGFFSRWRLYDSGADTSYAMRVVLMQENDPARAAKFSTEADARAFIDRVMQKATRYWSEREAAQVRVMMGVRPKRIISVPRRREILHR